MPRGHARGITDLIPTDHRLDRSDREPPHDEPFLGVLQSLRAGNQTRRPPHIHRLVAQPISEVQPAEALESSGTKPRLLSELRPRELLAPNLRRALRKLPEPLADRMAELLDQPHEA